MRLSNRYDLPLILPLHLREGEDLPPRPGWWRAASLGNRKRSFPMHRAEIDQEHNRLILRWVDSLSLSEIDQLQSEIALLLPRLKPDFDCISDISNMRPASRHVA